MRVIRKASLQPLDSRSIGVLGYGSQGRAQALNLRDAGFEALIGLPARSRSRRQAAADGFTVTSPRRLIAGTDIVFVLAPDHRHGTLFEHDLSERLSSGQMLVFAHASSVHFGVVRPPANVDVILLAPLGPGKRLRELAGSRNGIPCFFAIHQDYTGQARLTGLALARAIGCLPAGVIPTTFAEEAVGDLFGEQAVLCGGLGALLEAGVETLVRHGVSPQNAYLECVYQLDLIVDLIKSDGLKGMYERISPTAAYGARRTGRRIINAETRRTLDDLYREIESGRFFKSWMRRGDRLSRRDRLPVVKPAFTRAEKDVLRKLGPQSTDGS